MWEWDRIGLDAWMRGWVIIELGGCVGNGKVFSKCRTLKTSSRTVSVQVQRVSYKCQPGHKLFSNQCQTNGRNLIGSECHAGREV